MNASNEYLKIKNKKTLGYLWPVLQGYNIDVGILEHSLSDVGVDMGEMGSDDPVFTQDTSSIHTYKLARA